MGYTLGVADSKAFADWMHQTYLPKIQEEYPRPDNSIKDSWTAEEQVYEQYHSWSAHFPPAFEELYPGHLHIDLLPTAQGKGQGRAMMDTIIAALSKAGACGIHLEMATENLRAYGFYLRLGFQELGRSGDDVWMGIRPSRLPFTTQLRNALPPSDFVTGVIEGFYGRPWQHSQRCELLQRMAQWGMQMYIYAPKDDIKHRALWRQPYTEQECGSLQSLISAAHTAGVRFVYAIAPGLDIEHSSNRDRQLLLQKVDQVMSLGATSIAVLFDDIPAVLAPSDAAAFGDSAVAQASTANAVAVHAMSQAAHGQYCLKWPTTSGYAASAAPSEGKGGGESFHVPPLTFLLCPTEYCSAMSPDSSPFTSDYLQTLGRSLLPEYTALWTGPDVVSQAILPEHILRVSRTLHRRVLLWDNLHANDYDNGRRCFLGPYGAGRDADDLPSVCLGVLSNPNCEYEANFVPLKTLACFGHHARGATPWDMLSEAYLSALEAGKEADNVDAELLSPAQRVSGGFGVRTALHSAVQEWASTCWTTAHGSDSVPSHDDLLLVVDCLYLPYQLGPRAALLLATVRHALIATDFDGSATGLDVFALQDFLVSSGASSGSKHWRFTSHFPDAPDLNEATRRSRATDAEFEDGDSDDSDAAGWAPDQPSRLSSNPSTCTPVTSPLPASAVFGSPVRHSRGVQPKRAGELTSWVRRLGLPMFHSASEAAAGAVPAAPDSGAAADFEGKTDGRTDGPTVAMQRSGSSHSEVGDSDVQLGFATRENSEYSAPPAATNTHDLFPLTSPTLTRARTLTASARAVEDAKAMCAAVCRLFEISTRLQRRDLTYDMYRFLWDLKERCEVIAEYLDWASAQQAKELRARLTGEGGSPGGGGFTPAGHAPRRFAASVAPPVFASKWHKAGPIGGGIIEALDSMLVWSSAFEGFKVSRLAQPCQ